jgi:phospholipase C
MILSGNPGDYQYGFRVPLIVVSAFTPQRTINNVNPHDFGSVLKFIQGAFNIREGALGFADSRANGDLRGFFNFSMPPRTFQKIAAPLGASFFLNDKRPPEPPDND